MKIIILVGLLMLCAVASADDLLLGQQTYHFKTPCDGCEFRDSHPLIGYATEKYAVIAMINSYDHESILALRTFKKDFTPNLRGITSVGVGTGYYREMPDISVGKVTVMAYLGVDIHPASDKFGLLITYVPGEFIGAGLRIKL